MWLRPIVPALVAFGLAAAGPPEGWERALPEGGRLPVTVEPVGLKGGTFSGLALTGAWSLWSPHPRIGGLSGLLVEVDPPGVRILAATDQGWWFGGRFVAAREGPHLEDARIAPMRGPAGETYDKAGGDAEGLARQGESLAVSFERDHRVMMLRETGHLGGTIQARGFERLPSNNGLEALATLPDGRLLAFGEVREAAGVPMFLIGQPPTEAPQGADAVAAADSEGAAEPDGEEGPEPPEESTTEAHLPISGPHAVTGADVGPDGRLYLVLRHFSMVTGVSIRVMRYRLGEDGLPVAETAETLAAFEQPSGIDNMEGIALSRASDGGTLLWLVSDDNFSPLQHTLLLRFEVLD